MTTARPVRELVGDVEHGHTEQLEDVVLSLVGHMSDAHGAAARALRFVALAAPVLTRDFRVSVLPGVERSARGRYHHRTRRGARCAVSLLRDRTMDANNFGSSNLEEEFFRREDQRLLARLRELREAETARETLSQATGITSAAVLDRLLALKVQPEVVAALRIVPLVEVAWADGSLDEKERKAVLSGAQEAGIPSDSAAYALLDAWLKRRPEPYLLAAWTTLVQGMSESLPEAEVKKLEASLMERVRRVAGASGGVLGLGSKVSKQEAAVLQKLSQAFGRSAS